MCRALTKRLLTLSCAFFVSAAALAQDRPGTSATGAAPATAKTVGETVAELDHRLRTAREQMKRLTERSETLDAFAIVRGRAYVRLARAGLMPIGGGFEEFVDHAARLERLRKALERDLAEGEAVAVERQRLAGVVGELEARRELLEGEREALQRSHAAIAAAEEREAAFRRAFQSSYAAEHTAVYSGNAAGLDAQDLEVGFEGLRGRLPFPLAGRAEIRESRRGSSGPGLEMSAPLGSAVRAIFSGRVAFAAEYADFGRTVIVDHGDGYFSVTSGFDTIAVEPGHEIPAGATLGRVGRGGAVYVEIRQGQQTLPPSPWFGI